jgi:hypothetical protein
MSRRAGKGTVMLIKYPKQEILSVYSFCIPKDTEQLPLCYNISHWALSPPFSFQRFWKDGIFPELSPFLQLSLIHSKNLQPIGQEFQFHIIFFSFQKDPNRSISNHQLVKK